ncbi:MAG: GGDEF domain-containing protein, partial [Thermovirgaceae bacterium]|nr:GGDEF domain-containing protein [Thermovirgaceae bacterium]
IESLRGSRERLRGIGLDKETLEILGAGSKEELLENLPLIYQKDGSQLMKEEIIAIANGEESFEGEGINYTLDGRRLYVSVRWTIVRESGRYERVLLSVEDITVRKDLEDRLRVMSFCDALTGLSNRALFEEEIIRLESGRFDPLGLVSLDVDGLKIANDYAGHSAGDELLGRTGKVLKKVFRESDVIARIGGDEFAMLLPQCDIEGLKKILERLQEELTLENENSPCSIPLSLSVGWAWRENRESTIADMLASADQRMYHRKREAGGEYRKRLRENIEKNSGRENSPEEGKR